MNEKYSIKFLQILTAIIVSGLIIFLFPKAEVPSYTTITIGVLLAYIFIFTQISKYFQESGGSLLSKMYNILSESFVIVFIIIMLLILLYIFVFFNKKIYEVEPPQEFTLFKWVSYSLLVIQMILLFYYFKNLIKKTLSGSGLDPTNFITKMLANNLNLILGFFTLLNFSVTLIMYIIISKFTTDG